MFTSGRKISEEILQNLSAADRKFAPKLELLARIINNDRQKHKVNEETPSAEAVEAEDISRNPTYNDYSVQYEILPTGSKQGSPLLLSSDGYTYCVKVCLCVFIGYDNMTLVQLLSCVKIYRLP